MCLVRNRVPAESGEKKFQPKREISMFLDVIPSKSERRGFDSSSPHQIFMITRCKTLTLRSSQDRLGVTGLHPLPLPNHRICSFPHPAVEPSKIRCTEQREAHRSQLMRLLTWAHAMALFRGGYKVCYFLGCL